MLLRREPKAVARRIDGRDAPKQPTVLDDLIAKGGEFWGHLALDGLHLSVVQRRGVHAVDRGDAFQRPAAALERQDCVLERRRRWVVGDALHLAQGRRHPGLQGRLEVRLCEAPEWGDASPSSRPGGEERTVLLFRRRLCRRGGLRLIAHRRLIAFRIVCCTGAKEKSAHPKRDGG